MLLHHGDSGDRTNFGGKEHGGPLSTNAADVLPAWSTEEEAVTKAFTPPTAEGA